MQATTLSKKIISIILSVVLVFTLTPSLSYADDGNTQQDAQAQVENNNNSQAEQPEETENPSDDNSGSSEPAAQPEATTNATQEQTNDSSTESQAAPRTLNDTSAFEFIYIDQKEVELDATQSIVVSFLNKDNASTATLYYQKADGGVQTATPKQVEDGVALFELTFTSEDQIGTYKLIKATWGGNNPGEAQISVDEDTGYSFSVIAEASDDDPMTVYTIDDNGQLEEEENITEAIEESDNGDNQGIAAAPMARSDSRSGEMVIALDPGHGGSDPGAVNGSLVEKTLNLKIATYCNDYLEDYSGVCVYMTRSTDEYVGLEERVNRAANAGADVFVSFHINSAVGATGFEVWIQNDSSWRYYLHEESEELGEAILNKLDKFGLKNRGNKQNDAYTYPDGSQGDYLSVLRNSRYQDIPAVLIEHGFINGSAADQALLSSESSLKAMGEADGEAIVEYYGLSKEPKPIVEVKDVQDGSVTLSWEPVEGATKYAIAKYIGDNKYHTYTLDCKDNEYTITGLENGETYEFLVQAYMGDHWTSYSKYDHVACKVIPRPKPQVDSVGNGTVTLSWEPIEGATKYAISSQNPGVNYSLDCTDTTYTVSNLANGKEYSFLVQAYIDGTWSTYSEANYVKATPEGPTKPTPKVTSTGNGKVTLSWDAVSGATKYAISSQNPGVNYSLNFTGTSYTVTGLTNGKTYQFLVQAYVDGKWSAYSEADFVEATPVDKTAPKPQVDSVGNGTVTLSWEPIEGATKYAISSQNPGVNYSLNFTGTSYTVTGLTNGKTYQFLVQAYVDGKWSAYSEADFVEANLPGYFIMGSSNATVTQMISLFQTSGKSYPSNVYSSKGAPTLESFCQTVYDQAQAEGVRAEVLFAQVMWETGWLQFGGDIKPEQCNFGGLGATGNGEPGNSFPSVAIGLRAQAQHLKAYASLEPVNGELYDPRFYYVNPRGCAPCVEDLSGKWAADKNYGVSLVKLIERLLSI